MTEGEKHPRDEKSADKGGEDWWKGLQDTSRAAENPIPESGTQVFPKADAPVDSTDKTDAQAEESEEHTPARPPRVPRAQRMELRLRKSLRNTRNDIYTNRHVPMEPHMENTIRKIAEATRIRKEERELRRFRFGENVEHYPFIRKIALLSPRHHPMISGSAGGVVGDFILGAHDETLNPIAALTVHMDKITGLGELLAVAGIALVLKGFGEIYTVAKLEHLEKLLEKNEKKKAALEATKAKLQERIAKAESKKDETDKPTKKARLDRKIRDSQTKLTLLRA